MSNPYDNPGFAKDYVLNEADPSKNRYEWHVTYPSLLQFLDGSVENILDYGCGSGIFTGSMNDIGRRKLNPNLISIGTDASNEILRYAQGVKKMVDGVDFRQWDASVEDAPFEARKFDRIFAKLVLNYISPQILQDSVMPRLRESINDDGLFVAVLPNPIREAGYSKGRYSAMSDIEIDVGNFSSGSPINSYHHTYEGVIEAADKAGFAYGQVLGIPDVKFLPYKRQLMKVAHPMPMIFETLNAAKRWIYVFGATEDSAENFDNAVSRFESWRAHQYPEIADRAHMRVATNLDHDADLPLEMPHEALYDYIDGANPDNPYIVVADGAYAENLSARDKIKLLRRVARKGIRGPVNINDHLISL